MSTYDSYELRDDLSRIFHRIAVFTDLMQSYRPDHEGETRYGHTMNEAGALIFEDINTASAAIEKWEKAEKEKQSGGEVMSETDARINSQSAADALEALLDKLYRMEVGLNLLDKLVNRELKDSFEDYLYSYKSVAASFAQDAFRDVFVATEKLSNYIEQEAKRELKAKH